MYERSEVATDNNGAHRSAIKTLVGPRIGRQKTIMMALRSAGPWLGAQAVAGSALER